MGRTPSFLGIGTEKCGTTWLYRLLRSHRDIFMPERSEIHFFDRYYDRGLNWYESFFPKKENKHLVIGEITPSYLHCETCPTRIAAISSITKLFVMIRNPVNRAYSHYWHRVRIDRYSGTFEEFLDDYPEAVEWGFYSHGLRRYLRHFNQDQFMILINETDLIKVRETKERIAGFLGVAPDQFKYDCRQKKVNSRFIPRFHWFYSKAVYFAYFLRRNDLDWLLKSAEKIRIKQIFKQETNFPRMKGETRAKLNQIFESEIRDMEQLFALDLSNWSDNNQ